MGSSGAATLAMWFCCNLTLGYEQSSNDGVGSCGGEDFELLGQGGIGIERQILLFVFASCEPFQWLTG